MNSYGINGLEHLGPPKAEFFERILIQNRLLPSNSLEKRDVGQPMWKPYTSIVWNVGGYPSRMCKSSNLTSTEWRKFGSSTQSKIFIGSWGCLQEVLVDHQRVSKLRVASPICRLSVKTRWVLDILFLNRFSEVCSTTSNTISTIMINASMQALLIGSVNWALNQNPPPTTEQLHSFLWVHMSRRRWRHHQGWAATCSQSL
jgi:hypothetical protein